MTTIGVLGPNVVVFPTQWKPKDIALAAAQETLGAGKFAILLRRRRLSHSLKGALTAKPEEDPSWFDTFSLLLWCFVFPSRRWPPSAITIVAGRAMSAGS
jgi:hypothetical protein